jgi:CRISPR-associated protein Csx14
MLRDLVTGFKQEQRQVHICMSGGQRIMALLLMSVAMLQFSYLDKLWHVYTPRAVQAQVDAGALMHARPEDRVHLIQVPIVPLGMHFPALRELIQTTPATPAMLQTALIQQIDRERCDGIVAALSPRELETLQYFAAGLTPQEVAEEMTISLNTVNTYRKKIFELCRIAWPEQEQIRYHHLHDWFGPYFDSKYSKA